MIVTLLADSRGHNLAGHKPTGKAKEGAAEPHEERLAPIEFRFGGSVLVICVIGCERNGKTADRAANSCCPIHYLFPWIICCFIQLMSLFIVATSFEMVAVSKERRSNSETR